MVIAPIGDVQALAGSPGGVTFFEIAALCKDCPVEDIVSQIGKALPGARASPTRQVGESGKPAVAPFGRRGGAVPLAARVGGGGGGGCRNTGGDRRDHRHGPRSSGKHPPCTAGGRPV